MLRNGDVWCTGFAVCRRKVVTAAHCAPDATHVAEGDEVPGGRTPIAVIGSAIFPGADVGLLFLVSDLATRSQELLATTAQIDASTVLRVVGYGADGHGRVGVKSFGDVAIATLHCDRPDDAARFGCTAPYELVAVDESRGVDTGARDSGGPAFVGKGRSRRVAAIVKGSVARGRGCVDGSIYTRADAAGLEEWIRSARPVR